MNFVSTPYPLPDALSVFVIFGGKFVLHSAAEKSHEHIVGILLAWGAEVDMLDYKNRTPFEVAKGLGWLRIREMLSWKRRLDIWNIMNAKIFFREELSKARQPCSKTIF